jgi:hypothetical protein
VPSAAIPFPRISSPGERNALSGGRLVNAILEQVGGGEVVIKRAPGLTRRVTSAGGNLHCRGMIAADDETLLVVYNNAVEAVTRDGSVTASVALGNMPGSDLVTIARNNATTPDIVCVSPASGAFTLTTGGAPVAYPDADVGTPNSVCFLDGYFVFTYANGQFLVSGINSTAIDPLDFATAESSPDTLLRGIAFGGKLFLCGSSSIEVWINAANPPPGSPFSRSAVISRGIAAPHAIAGFEDGFVGTLLWAAPDNIVYKLFSSTEPMRVSTHDIEHDLQALSDKSTLSAFVFMSNGHPFWALKSPSWAWVYDLLTQTWQERQSYNLATWRAERSIFHWGEWLLGDQLSGRIYRADNDAYSEDGAPLVWEVTSAGMKEFPARFSITRADFDFVVGTGSPASVADPTVSISWSDDGGNTFSTPLVRALGGEGKYGQRVSINRLGRTGAHGREFKLVVSDQVFVGLTGGTVQTAQGAPF